MTGEELLSAPLSVNWSLSFRCNFSCAHCYSRGEEEETLPLRDLLAIAGRLRKEGVIIVNFGGGEPLLHPCLYPLAAHASRLGLRVFMNSNGWLLDRAAAARLREAGFAGAGISIDSPVPEDHDSFRNRPGSFTRALSALGHLEEAGIPTTVSCVVHRKNLGNWEEMIELCRKSGVGTLYLHNYKCTGNGFIHMGDLDPSPEEWREFYRRALAVKARTSDVTLSFDDPIMAALPGYRSEGAVPGSTCGKLSLHLRPNGDLTPCGFIPVVIGNILRDSFPRIWRDSPVLGKMREKTPQGKCAGCAIYADCLGGCSARAFALTGDFSAPDPHCWVGGTGPEEKDGCREGNGGGRRR